MSLEERLLARRRITLGGCWEWPGNHNQNGYGRIVIGGRGGRKVLVHRVAMSIWCGFDLASSLKVLHHCDNPPCFNPEHLYVGTSKDNAGDAVERGQMAHGERSGRSVLTQAQVDEIRVLAATCSKTEIAQRFRVTWGTVHYILIGHTWKRSA